MTDDMEFCKACHHPKTNHIQPLDLAAKEPCGLEGCVCDDYVYGETRVTTASGAQKGTKDARYDLIPIPALDELAKLYGFGAKKYAEHNWRLGYDWSLSYAAAQRHMTAFWSGEDIDPESGAPHVINAAFHMFALATFMKEHPELDDRFETRGSEPCSLQDTFLQEAFPKAFETLNNTLGIGYIPMPDGSATDLDILQKAGDDPIEVAAQWLATQPEGKTVSFSDNFTDEEVDQVFARAKEIQDSASND